MLVITLTAEDHTIRTRLEAREAGFTNVAAATAWNQRVRQAVPLPNEWRFDTTRLSEEALLASVISALSG